MLLQDVRGFSTKLAALTNEQLKQVAEIHQNDPYIFSMAVDESNRRKAAKVAEASRGEPKQTVVETELADMSKSKPRLPEEMGIGALPERSLSNMADGGIVGFKDEGLVQPAKTPAGRMFQGLRQNIDETNEAAELKNKLSQRYGTASALPGMFTEQSDAERENAKAIMGRLNSMSPTEMRFVLENGALPQGSSTFQPYDRNRKGNVPFAQSVEETSANAGAAPAPPSVAAPPSAAKAPRPPAALPAARPAAGAPTGAPPAANAAAGLQSLVTKELTAQDIVNARKDIAFLQDPVVDPLKGEREKIVAADKASGLEELQQHRDRVAKQGDPYAKQEERANKQEASVAESAERNPYLALMEAGFAAMAGDSPYAMVNLGKGALAGTKTYRDGLALIEKAKEKLTETRDRIDGLRLIRSDLNASEERTILNQNRKTALDGVRFMFEGISKATGDSKIQIENTLNIFTAAETARRLADRQYNTEVMKQGEETKRAEFNARTQTGIAAANRALQEKIAGMLPGDSRAAMVLGTGTTEQERLESGLQKAQEISGNPKLIIEAYTKYFKEMTDAFKTPMSPEAFATQTRALLAAMKKKSSLLSPQEEALVNKFAPEK